MSNYQKGDIVEFFNGENILEFGLIISVQVSDTISALVVSGILSDRPQWISTDRVKNHWKNLKGYVSTCDILKAENKELKNKLALVKEHLVVHKESALNNIQEDKDQFRKVQNEFLAWFCNRLIELINTDTGKGGDDE